MTATFIKSDHPPDFADSFTGKNAYRDKTPRQLAELAIASTPAWFHFLFSLRQKIARLAGLKTRPAGRVGADVSFLLAMPVIQDDESAYEAGLHDKHLDFTIRVTRNIDDVQMETRVWYKNFWGRPYLMLVLPFHNLIVSHWVKSLKEVR